MAFSYFLSVVDDEGNLVVEHNMTADEAIKILAPLIRATPPLDQPGAAEPVAKVTAPKRNKTDSERSRAKREKPAADRNQNKSRSGGNDEERTERIIAALSRGEKAGAIAAREKVSAQTVYNIKAKAKGQGLIKGEPETAKDHEPNDRGPAAEVDDERTTKVKELIKKGLENDFIATNTGVASGVVAFIRRRMKARGEL